jgi:hypothetical protein
MKNIVIINSYANSEEKVNLLLNYVKQVKKTNVDILLTSHLPLPQNIVELANYYIYDKENFLLPKERSPATWYADHEEYISLYCSRHGYAIIKNVYSALHFAKSLGYTDFIFSEYDNILSDNGVYKFQSIFDVLQKTEKKIFVFRLNEQRYNKYNIVYQTNFFAGNIDYFIKNITLVKSYEEWCTIMPYATTSEMIETLFVGMMQPIVDKVHEELTLMNSYFEDSKFDEFHIFDYAYPIIYNLENKNKPVFFILSTGGYYELNINNQLVVSRYYNKGEILKYKFDIDESDTVVELKCDGKTVVSKTVNIYSIENYKDLAVRGKIK